VGAICLLSFAFFSKTPISIKNIKSNFWLLVVSGGAIGFNWIFLFEAYRHTTIATATLCYYMAPVFVMLAAPLVLKEKLTLKKFFCIITAVVGMVFVSGVVGEKSPTIEELLGIGFGIIAALFYATVILLNRRLGEISDHNKTLVQLSAAAIVVLPYTLLAEDISFSLLTPISVALLCCVGVVHTGIAYLLYFGSMKGLSAQTVAIFSYIDPVVAIILSALALGQKMEMLAVLGAVLILASSVISELNKREK
jgi:RarD protein